MRPSRGLRWVDSPLSGGIPKAATGDLTLMQGGSPDDVAEAQAILSQVASNQTRMGGPGAGQTTKLINQVLCGLNFMAVAEATALAEAAGVDAAMIPTALRGGRADSAILQEYMPRFAARDYRRTGRIDNMVKDLNGTADLARLTHTPDAPDRLGRRDPPPDDRGRMGRRRSGGTDGILQGTAKGTRAMITRYALFEGHVHDGQTEAFRAAVMAELLPKWQAFPGALSRPRHLCRKPR